MHTSRTLFLATVALIAGMAPAWAADRVPEASARYATEHQQALRVADATPGPYAMNYTDQAAQSLGVKNGGWEAFDTNAREGNSLMPVLKGGIDHGGAMLRLQWKQGD